MDELYIVIVILGIFLIGEDRKKERDEREWEIIKVKFFVNKIIVYLIWKFNVYVIKKKKCKFKNKNIIIFFLY